MSKSLNIKKNDMIELKNTRKLFLDYIGSDGPWSYDEWVSLCDNYKAAVLYCQFFNTICLAYYKTMGFGVPVEDCISEALQYLNKNVSKIEKDESRYTEAYIYTVCYNCMFDLSRRKKFEYTDNEVGFIEDENGKTILDYYSDGKNYYEEDSTELKRREFWNLVADLNIDAKTVIAKLLDIDYDICSTFSDSGDVKNISRYRKNKITVEQEEEIIKILKDRLSCMVDVF